MCMNDFDFDDASSKKILYFQKPRSYLLQSVKRVYRSLFEYHDYYFQKNKVIVYRELLKINEKLYKENISFRVAIIPTFLHSSYEDYMSFENYPLSQIHVELKDWLLKNDIAVLDFLEMFMNQENHRGTSHETSII